MQIQKSLVIALVGSQCIVTEASWEKIAGYAPGSKVTSHNAIDLDQKALEDAMKTNPINYNTVKNIYQQGGNSKTYAEFTVQALTADLKKGDKVNGWNRGAGKMYASYAKGATTIKVAYATGEAQDSYVGCKGGALPPAPTGTVATAMTPYILSSECFNDEDLTVTPSDGSSAVTVKPTGTPKNKAGRTLQGFSTKAGGTMYEKGPNGGCKGASDRATDGCPYTDFTQYYNYYGDFDYADKFVLAAINGQPTAFTKPQGNMDFTGTDDDTRTQCIKKGTAYMNAYMYAIREFEDAIDDCKAGCPKGQNDKVDGKDCNGLSVAAVHAWDEGVAFYTGSLEGAAPGGTTKGKMSYRLAEKRCVNFKTCGAKGDSTSGNSYVNTELFKLLASGQNKLLSGECDATKPILRKMVALMAIPLIQGTLRYAYKVDKLKGGEKEKAEGAVFAAAIVPRVAHCSGTDAQIIMDNMKIGAATTSFEKVKTAFENQYTCMEITCKQVGGLWFESENKYYDGADPCSPTEEDGTTVADDATAFSVGKVIFGIAMIFCFRE